MAVTLWGFILSLLVAVPLCILAAVRQGSWSDHLFRLVASTEPDPATGRQLFREGAHPPCARQEQDTSEPCRRVRPVSSIGPRKILVGFGAIGSPLGHRQSRSTACQSAQVQRGCRAGPARLHKERDKLRSEVSACDEAWRRDVIMGRQQCQ